MWFLTVSGTACATAFAALLLLTVMRGRVSRQGAAVALACGLTVGWALLTAFDGFGLPGLVLVFESGRNVAWIAFIGLLLAPPQGRHLDVQTWRYAVIAAAGTCLIVLGNDLVELAEGGYGRDLQMPQVIGREGLAIIGILLVENLYRNTAAKQQWHIVPLCIAVGGLFAYELFLYSEALLFGRVNPVLADARPAVTILVVPFLALTMARNRDWRIDIHVSRQVVLHTLTLLASGVFLLSVAAVGAVLREVGGDWGPVVQIASGFGSLLVLATVLSSGSAKARLKYLISRNFFSLRYDYRVEWMSFIDILSSREDGEDLKQRVIRAVANIVDSPAGVLWLREPGSGFVPSAFWNMRLPAAVAEPADSLFVTGFKGGHWIQELDRSVTRRTDAAPSAASWRGTADLWLAVPLVHQANLTGFITFAAPRAPVDLNWESFDLLRAVGRQAASYLSEERSARALHDARALEEYGKRFAFVGHDIKNLASQLRMIVSNAQRHGDDPEFRADVFRTIESSVARMNKMLMQLRANLSGPEGTTALDPCPLIAEVAAGFGKSQIRTEFESGSARVWVQPELLRSALMHLIANAVEASPPGAAVSVRSLFSGEKLIVEVCDQGPGMDDGFIREQLFRPFRTTKSGGYGIGAYQTRELIRSAGGELEVISTLGVGTTMRIILPRTTADSAPSAAA